METHEEELEPMTVTNSDLDNVSDKKLVPFTGAHAWGPGPAEAKGGEPVGAGRSAGLGDSRSWLLDLQPSRSEVSESVCEQSQCLVLCTNLQSAMATALPLLSQPCVNFFCGQC